MTEQLLDSNTHPRRSFLGWAAAGFGLVAGAGLAGWSLLSPARKSGAQLPTRDEFAQQLHSTFSVLPLPAGGEGRGEGVKLELAEVSTESSQNAGQKTLKTFSVIFTGPEKNALEQQTCTFVHPTLGKMELFIVPVGKPKNGIVQYQAIFSTFA